MNGNQSSLAATVLVVTTLTTGAQAQPNTARAEGFCQPRLSAYDKWKKSEADLPQCLKPSAQCESDRQFWKQLLGLNGPVPKKPPPGPLDDARKAFVNGDYPTALRLIQSMAERGNAEGQCMLGYMHEWGFGVLQDYEIAIDLYRRAADQGLANAQFSLGLMYRYGIGTPIDYVQSHMWFNLAVTSGCKSGQTSRESVAREMSMEQIVAAQRAAREWKPKLEQKEPLPLIDPNDCDHL